MVKTASTARSVKEYASMANWCKGHLRIRGNVKDIKTFLKENIVGYKYTPKASEQVELKDTGYGLILPDDSGWLCFKDSRRLFPVYDYILFPVGYNDAPTTYIMPIQQAWGLDANWFKSRSEVYNLHIKVDGYEASSQFAQFIEVDCGTLLENKTISFDDWDWECPCPLLGEISKNPHFKRDF